MQTTHPGTTHLWKSITLEVFRNIFIEEHTISKTAMSTNTESLRDLYLKVAGDQPIVETQEQDPSRDPVGEDESELEAEVSTLLREDGLDDAVDGVEMDAGFGG